MFTSDRWIKRLFSRYTNFFYGVEHVFNSHIVIATTSNFTFRVFFANNEIRSNAINWNGPWYGTTHLKSCNHVVSNREVSEQHSRRNPYITYTVLWNNVDYVLLSSFGLGYTSYLSREGERHIIKKIPFKKYMEQHSHSYFDMNDSIPVHKISLSRLKISSNGSI